MERAMKIQEKLVAAANISLTKMLKKLPKAIKESRFLRISLKMPEKTLEAKAKKMATPSRRPNFVWEAPKTSIKKAGKRENTIREEVLQKKHIQATPHRLLLLR
jgi:hypothetical protein